VSFFAYPDTPSWCTPEGATILYLAHPHEDGVAALEAVAAELRAPTQPAGVAPLERPAEPTGRLDQFSAGQVIARYLPDGAIVADEAATNSLGPGLALATAAPHDHLSLTGGSIGQGLPVAGGAAVACPDRKVVCLHGDGGAMYTVQALWTQARERLDVTTVVFANRSYAILNIELMRVRAEQAGARARAMLDLGDPALDWVRLAGGLGVEAVRVETTEAFSDAFRSAMAQRAPRLIEVVL
jgi:acetolactate synthase-1/2/3 large subunit